MSRELQIRAGAGVAASAGVLALAVARPMPAAPLLVCFALLLGIVLLAAVWPRTEDIAVEAAQIKRDIDAKSTASANAFDTGATGAGAHRAPPRTPPTASTGPSPETRRQQWVRATEHHDAVLGAYGSYELDPAMLLRYPAMWDLSAQPVMDFHDALDLAGSLQDRAVHRRPHRVRLRRRRLDSPQRVAQGRSLRPQHRHRSSDRRRRPRLPPRAETPRPRERHGGRRTRDLPAAGHDDRRAPHRPRGRRRRSTDPPGVGGTGPPGAGGVSPARCPVRRSLPGRRAPDDEQEPLGEAISRLNWSRRGRSARRV
ncbi:hypothetical protein ACFOJ6_23940 [Gordonia humi]|uniref:hypothetical protein n=1 Tax=Gordonia humi TaxID=686429 RepID=UPI00360714FA